jgi:hypothetical protein
MKKLCRFLPMLLLQIASSTLVMGQQRIEISPRESNLKVYVFDSGLKFLRYIPVDQSNAISINPDEFSKNKLEIVITSNSDYYFIGSSQQIADQKSIHLVQSAPLPWIKIADDTKLITDENQYINIHAHGGLSSTLEEDLKGIIRLKLLGFNGFRLVFRTFNAETKNEPGIYLKTSGPPFNQTISGFTDEYINKYIVPKINLAKLLGMYVSLDHQEMMINDQKVSDKYEGNPDLYRAWLDVWQHLSEKFKDEPAVAFYEVQNEPGSTYSQDFVLKMHNDVIKLIRENDKNHIIAFGHSWANITQEFYLQKGIPDDPEKKLLYSMHHYYHKLSLKGDGGLAYKIAEAMNIGKKYKIPIWFGETGFDGNYDPDDIDMVEKWYDVADRNFISTCFERDDDIRGVRKDNTDENYISALEAKKRVFLSESNNWNIRCYRKDYKSGKSYVIVNPNPSSAAHIQINYPVFYNLSFSPDNKSVKIEDSRQGYVKINGNFKSIEVSVN